MREEVGTHSTDVVLAEGATGRGARRQEVQETERERVMLVAERQEHTRPRVRARDHPVATRPPQIIGTPNLPNK